jgi:hypothetical protein
LVQQVAAAEAVSLWDAQCLDEPMADLDLSGRRLGEFVLRDRIGAGGYGTVYRCEQPMLKRAAVVKVLHARRRRNHAAHERFLREAQLASRLDHPYAAHVYSFGIEHDGLLWIARVVHVAATRHPTQTWTAQQLRNATMDGDAPAVLLRDRDDKFGPAFDRAAQGVGAKVRRTPSAPSCSTRPSPCFVPPAADPSRKAITTSLLR